jgi:hypothetical protein
MTTFVRRNSAFSQESSMPLGARTMVAMLVFPLALLATTGETRAQTSQALTYFSHVATGFDGTPAGRGLAVTMAVEINTAMMYANFAAARPADLDAMKTNIRNVVHALVPGEGAKGPGLGFGVKRAAEAVVTEIERAAGAPGASEIMKKLGPGVANAARAVAARAQALADIGSRALSAQTAAEAAPLVNELRTMALELDTGKDANGNGRVDLDAIEPGMNQLEAQVYSILEGEKLPRILR